MNNEAFERAKSAYGTGAYDDATMEFIFPQLRESEDDRIRKWLLECVENLSDGNFIEVSRQEVLAYLEKQKDARNESNAESEDERTRKWIANYIHRGVFDEEEHPKALKAIEYLEKQKEQKPAEWSEEDEDMLNSCISSIEEAKENRYAYKETDGDTSYDHEIDWLKSLRPQGSKDSLQTHWKPSEEQPDFPTTDEEIEMFLATHPKAEVPQKYKTPDWLWKKQEQPEVFDSVAFQKGVQEGRRLEREDVKSTIQSRIDEILGDAQPNPILRMELQELIKKIEA